MSLVPMIILYTVSEIVLKIKFNDSGKFALSKRYNTKHWKIPLHLPYKVQGVHVVNETFDRSKEEKIFDVTMYSGSTST